MLISFLRKHSKTGLILWNTLLTDSVKIRWSSTQRNLSTVSRKRLVQKGFIKNYSLKDMSYEFRNLLFFEVHQGSLFSICCINNNGNWAIIYKFYFHVRTKYALFRKNSFFLKLFDDEFIYRYCNIWFG